MPKIPTRTSLMRAPSISTPPPICRSKATTVCAIKYGQCSTTQRNQWIYREGVTLPECEALAGSTYPAHGTMYYNDKTHNIVITKDFDECQPHCQVIFRDCINNVQFDEFNADGLTLPQCQAHEADHDPAQGTMKWTPAGGSAPTIENFSHCTTGWWCGINTTNTSTSFYVAPGTTKIFAAAISLTPGGIIGSSWTASGQRCNGTSIYASSTEPDGWIVNRTTLGGGPALSVFVPISAGNSPEIVVTRIQNSAAFPTQHQAQRVHVFTGCRTCVYGKQSDLVAAGWINLVGPYATQQLCGTACTNP